MASRGFEVEYAEPGGREVRAGLDPLRRVDLGACLPARSFPSYQGQPNYPGWFWSATMGKLVGFELRQYLRERIWTQPDFQQP